MGPQKVLHIAGWSTCGFHKRAMQVLSSISLLFPSRIKVIDHTFSSRAQYRSWLIDSGFREAVSGKDPRATSHTSSPFVWLSEKNTPEIDQNDVVGFVGGHDDTISFLRTFCGPGGDDTVEKAIMANDGYSADHGYDYDLVVIGGGSGGLAASKEAVAQGASKVAVLDYVKPSPAGTQWGLGGTCVNVGCIPKKLMHNAALINESIHADAAAFGLDGVVAGTHSWENMRLNVQNHIRGLNFKYRVNLRENKVTYLNNLAKFKDAHTIIATDKKGQEKEITAARFLVAVGGRPTSLDCEGGDLAISSDDVFSMEKSPGKTLCVGASYISLECAGFLAGLGLDVTVAVRSILLRGFDRECADLIGSYMKSNINLREKVVPTKLEKVGDNEIKVTFSDDSTDTYNTVLVAIGRTADTKSLGLENVGVDANPKNGKIITTHEQTSTPNIYAVGDVMEGCPELTPVAIKAGVQLAKRLFGGSEEPMDYRSVCTTVFTPLEYGTVGYSEEEAEEVFGKCNIEVYHKSFKPLEWELSEARSASSAFTKVIVDKTNNEKVLGMHFLGPSAGEVMQGYGTAMKKGITMKDLLDTVGIHPTSAEEIVTLSVTKSSGKDAKAAGC